MAIRSEGSQVIAKRLTPVLLETVPTGRAAGRNDTRWIDRLWIDGLWIDGLLIAIDNLLGRQWRIGVDGWRIDHEWKRTRETYFIPAGKQYPGHRTSDFSIRSNSQDVANARQLRTAAAIVTGGDAAFQKQYPDRVVVGNEDVEDRASDSDGRAGGSDAIGLLGGQAGDETERALDEIDDNIALGAAAVVDEFVEEKLRSRAQRQLRFVLKLQFADGVLSHRDQFVLMHLIAGYQTAAIPIEFRAYLIDNLDSGSNSLRWTSGSKTWSHDKRRDDHKYRRAYHISSPRVGIPQTATCI